MEENEFNFQHGKACVGMHPDPPSRLSSQSPLVFSTSFVLLVPSVSRFRVGRARYVLPSRPHSQLTHVFYSVYLHLSTRHVQVFCDPSHVQRA